MHTRAGAHRYVWPAELDVMAQLAGLELRERWSDWERNPFTGDSTSHVSVYEKPHSPSTRTIATRPQNIFVGPVAHT